MNIRCVKVIRSSGSHETDRPLPSMSTAIFIRSATFVFPRVVNVNIRRVDRYLIYKGRSVTRESKDEFWQRRASYGNRSRPSNRGTRIRWPRECVPAPKRALALLGKRGLKRQASPSIDKLSFWVSVISISRAIASALYSRRAPRPGHRVCDSRRNPGVAQWPLTT